MSVLADILRTYRAPRQVLRSRMAGPVREDRALAILMAACGLIFIAQWPRLAREAWIDPSISLDARLAGALFAWLIVMPLAFYVLAFVIRMTIRLSGSPATAYQVRMALFWALLSSGPLWLVSGVVAGFAGPGATFTAASTVGLAALVGFVWVGLSGLTYEKETS